MICTFIVQPPLLSNHPDNITQPVTRFIIASLIALTFIPFQKYSKKKHYLLWYRISIGSFAVSVVLVIAYFILINDWSVNYYDGDRLVKGKSMLKDAVAAKDSTAAHYNRAVITDEMFVKARLGQTETIWPTAELKARFYVLISLYISAVVFLSGFIMTIIQAISSYKKQPAKPMKILHFLLLAAGLSAAMTSRAQSIDVKQLVTAAFDTIKILAQVPETQLVFDNSSTTSSESTKKGSVIINMNQLIDILRNIDEKYRDNVVMLVVSHELAHQAQFARGENYPPLLKECQADILAGFFMAQYMRIRMELFQMTQHITEPNDPRIYSRQQSYMHEVYAALTAIFDLGDEYTADNTHPRNEQRRVAVRDGLTYGALWLADGLVKYFPVNSSEHTKYLQSLNEFKQLLDYLPNDDVSTWSYRHAKYVVHNQKGNCRNIIVQNDWKFDTSMSHPYCSYTHRIKNIGYTNVTLTFKDQMYTVLRSDPRNTLYWELVSNQSHLVTIAPDSVKVITGEIKWEADNKIMPTYVALGAPGSLYSCTSLNYQDKEMADEYIPALQTKPSDINVLDVILSMRDAFKDQSEGIGEAYDRGFNLVYYKSKQTLPFAKKTEIKFNRASQKYSLYVSLYAGKSMAQAKLQINTLINTLQEPRFKLNLHEVKEDPDHTYWEVADENNRAIGKIDLRNRRDYNIIQADFEVFGK